MTKVAAYLDLDEEEDQLSIISENTSSQSSIHKKRHKKKKHKEEPSSSQGFTIQQTLRGEDEDEDIEVLSISQRLKKKKKKKKHKQEQSISLIDDDDDVISNGTLSVKKGEPIPEDCEEMMIGYGFSQNEECSIVSENKPEVRFNFDSRESHPVHSYEPDSQSNELHEQIANRRGGARKRPRDIAYKDFYRSLKTSIQTPEVRVDISSHHFDEFMDYVRLGRHDVCITCWQFLMGSQRGIHAQQGHSTIQYSGVRDDVNFVRLCKDSLRYGPGEKVQLFIPIQHTYNRRPQIELEEPPKIDSYPIIDNPAISREPSELPPMGGSSMKFEGLGSTDKKHYSGLFMGPIRNVVPFLYAPFRPFTMIPRPRSYFEDQEKIETLKQSKDIAKQKKAYQLEENHKKHGFHQDMLSYGQLNLGFNGVLRSHLVDVFQGFVRTLGELGDTQNEIISELEGLKEERIERVRIPEIDRQCLRRIKRRQRDSGGKFK